MRAERYRLERHRPDTRAAVKQPETAFGAPFAGEPAERLGRRRLKSFADSFIKPPGPRHMP